MTANLRDTYAVFPKWTQPFWTVLTGKPLRGEQPLIVPSGWTYLAVSLTVFAIGTAGSVVTVAAGSGWHLLILLVTIPMTLMGSRLLILTIAHQGAHLRFCYSKRLNQLVHDCLTTIICSQNYDSYRYDHFHVHHGIKTFGTLEDPVLSFIRQLGFDGDLSKPQLWRKLVLTCASPYFHGVYLFNRLRHNFVGGRIIRRCMACVWWGSIIGLLAWCPHLILPVVVGYGIPVLLLYNASAFLELICEHVWMRPIADTDAFGHQRITELCWGRFCGEAVPAGERYGAWIRWGVRMLFYHLPCRMLVLAGDAPQHDFHHVVPNGWRWTVSAYERRDTIATGKMEDREVWGLLEAIDIVFDNLSTVRDHQSELKYLVVERKTGRPGKALAESMSTGT